MIFARYSCHYLVLYLYIGEVAYNQPCVLSMQIKSQKLISTRVNHVHVLNEVRILINALFSNNSTIRVAVESRHLYWFLLQKYARLVIYLELYTKPLGPFSFNNSYGLKNFLNVELSLYVFLITSDTFWTYFNNICSHITS